jgi:hypothetical protein
MFDNKDVEGGDATIDNIVQCWARAPVYDPDRQVAQHVNNMCADPFLQRHCQFWPDTRQHGCRREQAKYFSGASWMHLGASLLQNGWTRRAVYNKAGGKTKTRPSWPRPGHKMIALLRKPPIFPVSP